MKIYINNPQENWVVDRFVEEWIKYNQHLHTHKIKEADLVWIISPWTWKKLPMRILKKKKVLCTIHHIDESKFKNKEEKDFLERDKIVDVYHCISQNTEEQVKSITRKKTVNLPFWANQNIFFDIKDQEKLRDKYKISKNDFLIGSFQRDTEGKDLVSPKLSKGPDQFVQIVKNIQKKQNNIAVLLTGRRRQYVINELKEAGIKYYYFEMVSFDELNEMYNMLNLYIVSSRVEGGPQSILECGLSKTPIISTDVGIASQILSKESIYDFNRYNNPLPNIDIAYKNSKKFIIPDWFDEYEKLFNETL
tara:strand:+ start:208 stop:1125 length:918 start_codon:yes stop_codon:yes gene_type:complete